MSPSLPFNARADLGRDVPKSCLLSVKEAKEKGAEVVSMQRNRVKQQNGKD